jgi:asparagine synthase (glutamine-hydrolysing)
MAGLMGVVQDTDGPLSDAVLAKMRARAVHRGVADGLWREGGATLAWSGPAPCTAIDDDFFVLLDGWVSFPGADPKDPQARLHDAATFAAGWRKWGVDLLRQLEGEFAAAVVERKSGVVHLVRDPCGTRPLYWARTHKRLAFSSDLAPLLELDWVSRELARENLAEYLSFRVVHPPRTLLRDVFSLPAGHRLRSGADAVRVVRWFSPTYAAPGTATPRAQDVVPELTAAVEAAVRRRLRGDANVGVYLSGGVGSTSILAAARAASRKLQTFTVAFADEPSPESPFAGRIAQLLGMDHHTVLVGTKEVADGFDDAVDALGHPIGNISAVLQLHLARATVGKVSTILTGDGTDELFGGRMLEGPAASLARSAAFHRLPNALRAPLDKALAAIGRGDSVREGPETWALSHGVGGLNVYDSRARRSLLLDDLHVRPNVRQEVLRPFYDAVDTDPLNAVLEAFFQSSLVADTLPRVEGTAASVGLDVGYPLLDREVRRIAQVLPGAFKVGGVGRTDLPTRWLLRAALQGAVPAALVNRPDRELPRPLDAWLTGPGRLFLEERFAELRRDPLELFHTTALEALKRGLSKTPGAAQRMWSLLILDAWMRRTGVV